MAGLYIHIPFCAGKCGYCDFYSENAPRLKDAFLEAAVREMKHHRDFFKNETLRTVYLGGGTPSLLTLSDLALLLDSASKIWDFSMVEEVTIEVNPDDMNASYAKGLVELGFNRVSIGIQSFHDPQLRFMNRRHDSTSAQEAIFVAREAGFSNISIDLIYGLPGFSDQDWMEDIQRAIDLRPQHISAYHLTIEDGTSFGSKALSGILTPVDEEVSELQYSLLHGMLTCAGYEHYEISNFALPEYRSRHNSSYWSGSKYLGIGPSAHSFDGQKRWSSPPSIKKYTDREISYAFETLTELDKYNEYIMTSLRTSKGLDVFEMEYRFGNSAVVEFKHKASVLVVEGVLVETKNNYYIPSDRFLISDTIISSLFADNYEAAKMFKK